MTALEAKCLLHIRCLGPITADPLAKAMRAEWDEIACSVVNLFNSGLVEVSGGEEARPLRDDSSNGCGAQG